MLSVPCRITLLASVAALITSAAPNIVAAEVPTKPPVLPSHPVIPGFERFYTSAQADTLKGGHLLLGELNCTSCHQAQVPQKSALARKQAPILDSVGARVKKAYLRQFLADPHAVKPGTTMPQMFAGVPEKNKAEQIEALVHFLASTGSPRQDQPEPKLVPAGKALYHQAGCVACHGTRDLLGNPAKVFSTSVPLVDLKEKYTLGSLIAFLENPHQVRPGGRMPGLLTSKEAREAANYLLQGLPSNKSAASNLRFAYYEGHWDRLPDFATLKPKLSGLAHGFDLSLARRRNYFAMKFEGYLNIERDAEYVLHLTSDDGSKLFLDGKLIVANDGIHAPSTKSVEVWLTLGVHKLAVGVFNAGGGAELEVDIEGRAFGRQDITSRVSLKPAGDPAPSVGPAQKNEEDTPIQAALVEKGRSLFTSVGCANCHPLHIDKKALAAGPAAAPLDKLRPEAGCLAQAAVKGAPWYALSATQRTALAAALKEPAPAASPPEEVIARTMTTFNCYACHERAKIGGVEEALNPLFTTEQSELGDEGRIPPPLDGVGAKLSPAYLKKVLDKGADDRPYMHTRMPRFGSANVGHLAEAFASLDKNAAAPQVTFRETPSRVKTEARHLIGGQALGCIKCHTFAGHKAEGLQGIDMTLMTQRLQRDWFHRYLLDPQKIRPGTHMPAAWYNGISPLPQVLGGDTSKQIEAIWVYLSDGKKAQLPLGLKKEFFPLIPDKEAIVYRNFIEGAGSRAIAVGYPEKAHLAFDANDLRLAMIWQGAFLDAARHWTGRGGGYEPPLGDGVQHFPVGVGFAVLAKGEEPWPTRSGRELGYHFQGYRLGKDGRPTFLYACGDARVEDFPDAVAGKPNPSLRRTLTVTAGQSVNNLWFRAAAASKIEDLGEGWYRINGELRIRIEAAAPPRLRQSGGQKELLVPVRFQDGRARIVQEFVW